MSHYLIDKNIKLKIIIVDDSKSDHFFIKKSLSDFKHISFDSFYDGAEFLTYILEAAKKHGKGEFPDIVILDINMPKLTGFEVFEKIKKKGLQESIKFFILTTSLTDHDLKKCKELQVDCYLKPFSVDHFGVLLQKIIKERNVKKG